LSGVSVLACWINASRESFLAFVVLYGIFAGGYSSLLPTCIAEIYGREHYSSANAAIYCMRGIGAVFGAPIAGAMLGNHPLGDQLTLSLQQLKMRYNHIAAFDGVLFLVAGVCVVLVRWYDAKFKGTWSWKA
jgi:MFS family permease